MKKIRLLMTGLLLLVTCAAFAQNIKVTGTVIDSGTDEPVAGATVRQQGNSQSYAMTDGNGVFHINVPADATLEFSFVGYRTEVIAVNGKAHVNVEMTQETTSLEDVIVVAYGTVKKEAKTGAVASMKSKEIAEPPISSVDKMLAGKMAGVSVQSYSGQPGSVSSIRIRGVSSINAGNEPLWVIDGIPIDASDFTSASNTGDGTGSSISFLNPSDIESITVLKDAAAASIYGSRAANGVILVNTKSGKQGRSSFTARVKIGASQIANDNNFRSMTSSELLEFQRAAIVNAGMDPDDPSGQYYRPYSLLSGEQTNWADFLTRVGMMQEYEINATGGTSKASYYSSLAYHKNEGVLYGSDYQRFSARVNADFQLLKNLKTGAKINFTYEDKNGVPTGNLYYANPIYAGYATILPWIKPYNEDGTYNTDIPGNSYYNPRALAEYDTNNDKSYRGQGTMYLEYKPIKQLTLKTNNGFDVDFVNTRIYQDSRAHNGAESKVWSYWTQSGRITTSNTIAYDDLYAGVHKLNVLAGQEAMKEKYTYLGLYSPGVDPAIPYPTTSTGALDEGSFGLSSETLLSFFGQASYEYDGRYIINGSIRGDGSSLFGRDTKWGLFWSASASWNINNEKWLKGYKFLDLLKLRASIGTSGNNNIGRYLAYGTYAPAEYNAISGYLPSTPANPQLSWEKCKTWNVGVDFGFWGRFNGSIDFYDRVTDDMLLNVRVPQTTGFTSNIKNAGSVRNRGFEMMLEGDIIKKGDFLWNLGGNIAVNRSKVLDLAGNEFITVSDSRTSGTNAGTCVRIVEGMNMYNFYIREWAGVDPSTGEGLFVAEDGTLTSDRTKGRYIYAGSPEAKFTGGFNTTFSWKGLSLSAYFDFSYGNKVMVSNFNWYDDDIDMNVNAKNLDYWTPENRNAANPKPIAGASNTWYAGYSTRFMQDGSYLRIKDITLSYNFPQNWMSKAHMKGLKVYVSGLNLYTFHKVDAFDPDFGETGTQIASYPTVKTLVGGIELTF